MKTKIELIDRAYSKLRISGITVNPNPTDINIALDEMECMLAEWELVNVGLGYNFEDQPDPNTESGIVRGYENGVQTNLAVRLAPEFGKSAGEVMIQASQSYSKLSSAVAKVKQTPYPNRQPVGGANTLRTNRWRRFYDIDITAPNSPTTEIMAQGDVTDSSVNYSSSLEKNDFIVSATLIPSNGLTIETQSFTDSTVDFRVKADIAGTQFVKIEVVTNDGLESNECLYYSVAVCGSVSNP